MISDDIVKTVCVMIGCINDSRSMSCNSAREGSVTTLNIKLYEINDRHFDVRHNNRRLIFSCFDYRHCIQRNQASGNGLLLTWNVTEHPPFTENTASTKQPSFRDFSNISLNIFNTTRETVHGNWTLMSIPSFGAATLLTHCTVYVSRGSPFECGLNNPFTTVDVTSTSPVPLGTDEVDLTSDVVKGSSFFIHWIEIIKNLTCSKNISGRELEIDCMASNIHHASKCTFHVNYTEPLYPKAIKLTESEIWQGNEENILDNNDTYITRCSIRLRQLQVQGARYDIAVTMYPDGNNTMDYIKFGTTEMFSFEADVVFPKETVQEMKTSLTTEDGANLSVPVGVTFGVISLVLFIVAVAIIARKYKVRKQTKRIVRSRKNPLELQQDQNDCYDKTTFEVECVYQNIKEDDNESTYLNKVGGKLAASTNKNEELAREGTLEGGDNPYEEI